MVANMLRYDIGEKVETFVGLAPVMYSQYQNSVLLHEMHRFRIDLILENAYWSLLFVQEDTSFKSRMFLDLSLWALDRFPRTSWKAIEGLIGFNIKTHIDYNRMPMMVENDLGGSSTQNFKHWMQIWFSDSFQTLKTRN